MFVFVRMACKLQSSVVDVAAQLPGRDVERFVLETDDVVTNLPELGQKL